MLGDPEHAFENYHVAMPAENLGQAYEQRLRLTVDAEDDESLILVLGRAARQLGITETHWGAPIEEGIAFCAFYREDDREGWARNLETEVTLVDGAGHAIWGVRFKADDVTLGELIRAGEHGALNGDPLRPYLILAPPHGNGYFLPWVVLSGGLALLWSVMQALATVEDTLSFGERVISAARDRLGRGQKVVEEHYTDWAERGGTPSRFMKFLGQRPWATADLAELLDCSEVEAEAILWAFGYTRSESGLWRTGGDKEAELLRAAVGDLGYSFSTNPAEFERLVSERTTELVRTGQVPPEPTYEEGDLPEEEDTNVELVEAHCACGRDDCEATAKLMRTYLAGDEALLTRLRIVYNEPTDHFVFNLDELGALLGAIAAGH